jgi:MFS family permease
MMELLGVDDANGGGRIVFRALQGIGGSGLYSMTMVIVPSLTPPRKRSMIGAYIALCVTTSGVLGPILGGEWIAAGRQPLVSLARTNDFLLLLGAITNHRDSYTWPWIFWINLPIAGTALVVFLSAWPSGKASKTFSLAALLSIDFLGCLLLLAASTLLVFALLEAGTFQYEWHSPVIVVCLVLSAASLSAFILWQSWIAAHPSFKIKVVFPVKTITQRVVAAGMISTFLSGFIYYIAVVNLPERFQIVSRDSPITAGLRLLPMLVFSGIGAILGGFASARRNNTSYTLILASAFQLLGYGLMTTLGLTTDVPAKQYGFQIFLGLGFGMTMSSATQMMHLQAAPQWLGTYPPLLSPPFPPSNHH